MERFTPRTTLAAVVERAEHFLFVEELIAGELYLNQPAGHLEAGESLQQACVRECLEETGHSIEPTALLGVYQWTSPRDKICFMRYAFIARLLSTDSEAQARRLDPVIVRVLWLHPEEVRSADAAGKLRSPLVLQCVEDYLAKRSFSLNLIQYR